MPGSLRRETSRKTWLTSAAGAFAVALALTGTAWADEVFSLKNVIPIPGAPLVSFDISWTDPILQRYYLGDRSNKSVDVIELNTNAVTQFQPGFVGFTGNNDTSGPDGVMTIDDGNIITLWVGDGQSRVWVLDPRTGALADTHGAPNPIPTSPVGTNPRRADELCFDPVDHLVMVANNADDPPFASIISTTSFTVVKKIVFNGTNGAPNSNNGAEQCAWSPRTGKFYISIPGIVGQLPDGTAGGVAVIDPKTLSVATTFLVPPASCEQPQGMAVGPAPQILLGCNVPSPDGVFKSVIIDENTGAVIATLPNEGGADEVWFNPGDGHYAISGGSFLPNEQLGIVDSGSITGLLQVDQTIPIGNPGGTTRRAHSVATDANTNLVYVPIPATGGGTPGFQSSICGTTAQQAAGCVAVFGASAPEAPPN